MKDLILDIFLQYVGVGFFCTVFVDIMIRMAKVEEPFSFLQILTAILLWPVIVFTILNSILEDFFN